MVWKLIEYKAWAIQCGQIRCRAAVAKKKVHLIGGALSARAEELVVAARTQSVSLQTGMKQKPIAWVGGCCCEKGMRKKHLMSSALPSTSTQVYFSRLQIIKPFFQGRSTLWECEWMEGDGVYCTCFLHGSLRRYPENFTCRPASGRLIFSIRGTPLVSGGKIYLGVAPPGGAQMASHAMVRIEPV